MRWEIRPPQHELGSELAGALGISPFLGALLVHRGQHDARSADAFLRPSVDQLLDPFLLRDMDRAFERIRRAIRDRERILVYGDYDVDGISGTALLLLFFRFLGVEADFYIPNRLTEGYSITGRAVEEIARRGVGLVVSIDNGTSAVAEIDDLARRGIDVVVTDHHEVGGDLPRAHAVVNPKRPDCEYPFKLLAGVGVAFKVVTAMASRLSPERRRSAEFRRFLFDATALAALGTISDVVPLTGENRVLAAHGLRALASTELPGVRALLETAKVASRSLDPWDIGYRIGPRLNAAGRMGNAGMALRLLTERSIDRARELAARLEKENARRQGVERRIHLECRELLDGGRLDGRETIVLGNDGWHRGVLGVVASKIADEFHRPTILFAFENGRGRGSARSVPGFHVLDAIRDCSDRLVRFGGHAFAAGLEIDRVEFDAFSDAFDAATRRRRGEKTFAPTLTIDLEVPLDRVDPRLVRELERLAPYGEQNPAPLFVARGVRVAGPPALSGKRNQHLKLWLNQGGVSFRGIGYDLAGWIDRLADSTLVDVAFHPRSTRFEGREEVEFHVRDLRLHEA